MDNRINDVEQLRRFCMKKDIDEIGEYLEKNYGAKFVDEWIDDGTEEDGVYVNGVAYRFPNGGIIDFFFGSDDRIISYVDTRRMKRLRENKQTVRLTEKQLRKVVADSVKKIINETWNPMRPSEKTLAKAKELYDYLYDAQEESDATCALYKMISDWLNEQIPGGETPSYIGG